MMQPERHLAELKEGHTAWVRKIEDHPNKARLVALGFRPGKMVTVLRKSKFSTNMMVRILGSTYGLRPEEARHVLISEFPEI